MRNYILQTKEKGYSACYIISILNACIYYGHPYLTSLDDPRWEDMVDRYKCRYGACLNRKLVRDDIGIKGKRIDRDEIPKNIPAQITSFTKVGFHSSLVIGTRGDDWTIVNYDGYKGDVITVVNKNSIEFLKRGHSNDEHYFLFLENKKRN